MHPSCLAELWGRSVPERIYPFSHSNREFITGTTKTKPPCPTAATELSFTLQWSILASTALRFAALLSLEALSEQQRQVRWCLAREGRGELDMTQNAALHYWWEGERYTAAPTANLKLQLLRGLNRDPRITWNLLRQKPAPWQHQGIPKACWKSHFKDIRELSCQCRTPSSTLTFPVGAQAGPTIGNGVLFSAGTGCSTQPPLVFCQLSSAFRGHVHLPLHGRNMQCGWRS